MTLDNRLVEAKRRLSDAAATCLENRPGAGFNIFLANGYIQITANEPGRAAQHEIQVAIEKVSE